MQWRELPVDPAETKERFNSLKNRKTELAEKKKYPEKLKLQLPKIIEENKKVIKIKTLELIDQK